MNIFTGIGRLTKDVEIHYTQKGQCIGNTSMALNEHYFNDIGEKVEITTFIDLRLFGRKAEVANQYLRKGSKIGVQGKLQRDDWISQDGQKKQNYYIFIEKFEMLDQKPKENSNTVKVKKTKGKPKIEIDNTIYEDEIPF